MTTSRRVFLTVCAVVILTTAPFLSLASAEDTKTTRLDVLRTQFETKKAEIFKPAEELKALYEKQLDELQSTAQVAGNLDLVLAVGEEVKALRDRTGAVATPSKHAALARLQKIYSERTIKLASERVSKMTPLATAYRDQLDALIKDLTKEGDFTLAVATKKERAMIDAIIVAGAGAARFPNAGMMGRFVRIELTKNTALSLTEVEIFCEGKNIATKGKASQSSTYKVTGVNPTAEKAIDGNKNAIFLEGSVTHTKLEPSPWWEVDLNKEKELSKVVIWNRADEKQRLDGFKLSVLNADRKTVWEITVPKAPEKDLEIELSSPK